MPADFTRLLARMHPVDGGFAVDIPPDWMQGRTTYGGLSAALCLEGALRTHSGLPPLRSAQISFVGPAGGPVKISSTLLRQGRSVAFAGADLHSEQGLATRAVFAFGAGRASAFERTFTPQPDVPAPEECDVYISGPLAPPFAQHYEARLARGGRPVTGSTEHDHFIWVRHRDAAASSVVGLLALADMPPPAMMPMFTGFAPISSMTWQVNFLAAAPQTRDGWWLLQSRAENAAEGYSSQDMLVWNRDGEMAIAGRQSVAIFA